MKYQSDRSFGPSRTRFFPIYRSRYSAVERESSGVETSRLRRNRGEGEARFPIGFSGGGISAQSSTTPPHPFCESGRRRSPVTRCIHTIVRTRATSTRRALGGEAFRRSRQTARPEASSASGPSAVSNRRRVRQRLRTDTAKTTRAIFPDVFLGRAEYRSRASCAPVPPPTVV